MIRTINNLVRTLLIQASMPEAFWVEAVNASVHLLNLLPSSAVNSDVPFTRLFKLEAKYSHLRTFGCLCYPNILPTTPHKLAPRSTPCAFLGYPTNHRGYRCLELSTRRVILSRHVTFVESLFPFSTISTSPHISLPSLPIPLPPTIPRLTSPQPTTSPTVTTLPSTLPSSSQNNQPSFSSHPMITRSKNGITKP